MTWMEIADRRPEHILIPSVQLTFSLLRRHLRHHFEALLKQR
jgi:hypothetical protein